MIRKCAIFTFVGLLLPLISSAALAQEQWLQYRTSTGVQQDLAGVNWLSLAVSYNKPAGVGLPKFECDKPAFAQWRSPRVKGGGLWIALDRQHKLGPYDRLYIDSNCDGSLADEQPSAATRTAENYAEFGPVRIALAGEDGPTTHHLSFFLSVTRMVFLTEGMADSERMNLYAASSGWYEGSVTVNGKKWLCRVTDENGNGTFNDTGLYPSQIDRISVARAAGDSSEKPNFETGYVGKYIELDGALYQLEVPREGDCVKFTPAGDVPMAAMRISPDVSKVTIVGENGGFNVRVAKGEGKAPVGKYTLVQWQVERKDAGGASWQLTGGQSPAPVDLAAGGDTALAVGEPVTATIQSAKNGDVFYVTQSLAGHLGESITLTCNGQLPPAPKLHVTNADKSYDQSFTFQYG